MLSNVSRAGTVDYMNELVKKTSTPIMEEFGQCIHNPTTLESGHFLYQTNVDLFLNYIVS